MTGKREYINKERKRTRKRKSQRNIERTTNKDGGTRDEKYRAREKVQEKRKKERETEDGKVVGMRSRARRNSGDSIRVSYELVEGKWK